MSNEAAKVINIFSPRGEVKAARFDLAPRPRSLDGVRVGFLDNGKSNANVILQRLAEIIGSRYNVAAIIHKPRRRPGENWRNRKVGTKDEVIDEMAEKCDVVINGVGD